MPNLDEINRLQQCTEEIGIIIKKMKRLNILIAGKTGVGKSTLINAFFRDNLAATGIGTPVTEHLTLIEKPDIPVRIYDTMGLELDKNRRENAVTEIVDVITKGAHAEDINEKVHCIWYCINAQGRRFEPAEEQLLKEFTDSDKLTQVPLIVVLTQSSNKGEARAFADAIREKGIRTVVPVLATAEQIEQPNGQIAQISAYGLDTLLTKMFDILPDELDLALNNVQKVSLQAKIDAARYTVDWAAKLAGAVGGSPIPISDSMLLIPGQVGMITKITYIFGFNLNSGRIIALLSSLGGVGAAGYIGKTIVAGAMKLVPGAGYAAGAAIASATAYTFTKALGEAYIRIMIAVSKGEYSLDAPDLKERMQKTITEAQPYV